MSNILSDFIVWFSQPVCLIFKLLSAIFFFLVLFGLPPAFAGESGLKGALLFFALMSFIFYRIAKYFERAASVHSDN